ncbi:hypothetical protein UFOVP1655_7 [uncultured Caudovirales phage]|uniref:Baseplate wedge subunit n=1 Tax=uncultured Caudovirales phage TaxID=2100421 RepID=A0A6J5T2G5_9CAUD|nr:hypothetical protein UFOVP1655_7 [uncultured Caudovirales phage]
MIKNHNLTSLLIPSQLPEHIRDDPAYANFVVFLQAYYEWLEEDGNVTERAKNLLNYKDVDKSTDEFLKYYYNDFLSYFPEEIMEDKVEVIKLAKQLYQYKGTPASYQLLFRILYNSDVEFLNTKDVTLKASSGLWYVAKSLKLSTDLMYISELSAVGNSVTVITTLPHYLLVGDEFTISDIIATNAPNGSFIVTDITSIYEFTYVTTVLPVGPFNISNCSVYIPKGYANENFLLTNNLRIFGETTKSIATIENSVISGKRIEVFISDIERLFESGEYVRIVDSKNRDVYFTTDNKIAVRDQNGNYPQGSAILRAKILGQISQVIVNQKFQGSKYQGANTATGYIGDPVVFDGGLNTITGHGAKASVEEVTTGSITRILVDEGGYGYTEPNDAEIPDPAILANTKISIAYSGGALAHVGGITTTHETISTVTFIPRDMVPINYDNNLNNLTPVGIGAPATIVNGSAIQIGAAQYQILFANNFTANANTTLANAFTFMSFTTGSISSVVVDNGGGGIDSSNPPVVSAKSLYKTCVGNTIISLESFTQANLKDLGILAPIQILSGGSGYSNNSIITFVGGTGYGANAKITSVDTGGKILSVDYTANGIISLGGLGYQVGEIYPTQNIANTTILNTIALAGGYKLSSGLPLVKPPVTSGANAVMIVPGILGDGALFTPTYTDVGNITNINITDFGEDYIAQPKVSLKVQDIIVYGFLGKEATFLPQKGDVIYQGTSLITANYKATVDSVIRLIVEDDPIQSVFLIRVYNYTTLPDGFHPIKINSKSIVFNIYGNLTQNQLDGIELSGITNDTLTGLNFDRFKNGILVYGDGSAKATAAFLNGLTISNGQYLDTTGQPSSYNILQSQNYNNFTYQITVEKEISKYRKALLDLLHPTGMKVIGRYPLKSSAATNFNIIDVVNSGSALSYFTGSHNSGLTMVSNFTNQSNNIIKFNNLYGANLQNFITTNNSIQITSSNNDYIYSEVISVNNAANTVTLKDNVWLTFANVAQITANASSNVVHISYLTNSYDVINNGKYSDTNYPLKDIVRVGDAILVANNTSKTVSNIDYANSTIYLSTNLANTVNSLMSVTRTFTANSENIKIFGPVGQQYYPEITDESGNSLISEDGSLILLG